MASLQLSPIQANALFEILTHYETYSEIESWKWPDAVWRKETRSSQSPLLRLMFKSFVMTLPGLSTLPSDFWQNKIGSLIANLSEAGLSESFDKGSLGTRKTLSTAHSVIIENIARGYLGGCPGAYNSTNESRYDRSNAEDLKRAWDEAIHQAVYGNLIDELFDTFKNSEQVEDLSPMVQAALKHIFLMSASFAHHIFVLSPSGQNIIRLLSNANKLIPYIAIKQALRVGNAASMINAVMKLILTKLSVTAVTNWMRLSNNADEGMNLLQQIISSVLSWDSSDFKDITSKIKKSKDGPSKEHLDAIDTHIDTFSYERHQKLRAISIEQSKSIISVIFENAMYIPSTSLTEVQHTQALEYYSARLSIRDRKEITRVLCRQYPDNLTQSIRDGVGVYEPLIRSVHEGVNLSTAVGYVQDFLEDLIKTVKPKSGNEAPSVSGFASLFRRHVPSILKILHQVVKNCPDWASTWRAWCKESILEFRKDGAQSWKEGGAAGSMTDDLMAAFSALPEDRKPEVLEALDAHACYLNNLSKLSMQRAQSILDNDSTTMHGPGVYLARWHNLLDETLITPAIAKGKVRRGMDVQFKEKEKSKTTSKGWWDSEAVAKQVWAEMPEQPNVEVVVKLLGRRFRELLQQI